MKPVQIATCLASLAPLLSAAPTITSAAPGKLLGDVVAGLGADATNAALVVGAVVEDLQNIHPTATPTSPAQVASVVSSIFAESTEYVDSVANLISNGFDPRDLRDAASVLSPRLNSIDNVNSRAPKLAMFPKKSDKDAPYSVAEKDLRGAMYFPSTFTYGKKPPVILFPGTGAPAGETFVTNYGKLLAQESFADPMWVNIPNASLDDAQVTAEYAAYAINYISDICEQNVSVVTFSQGSMNLQWALKYWPSTRSSTSTFVALSPDFHGTVLARLLCPVVPNIGCTESILQQAYDSQFVQTLLADGGDSAYVPTTTVFSVTDEIVQPQNMQNGSGLIKDARHVGVSNSEVQSVCFGQGAGVLYTHEGMVINSLGYALAKDALTHAGPGELSRIDTSKVCKEFAAPGLSLTDVLVAEGAVVTFFTNFLTKLPRVEVEPAIKAYA